MDCYSVSKTYAGIPGCGLSVKKGGVNLLSIDEIKQFISEDEASDIKSLARVGQAYYDGEHDILNYRIYYFNADGELVEDTTRNNIKIPHPFFTELVDQCTQYILSGDEGFIRSDLPELQTELDAYFNENEDFIAELSEVISGCQTKGYEYMYAYKDSEDKLAFQCADSLNTAEVRAKDTDDKCEHVIYWYIDRIDKGHKQIRRIEVWDSQQRYFYVQDGEGEIRLDDSIEINPMPHVVYEENGKTHFDDFGLIPFFRMDNNKKKQSDIKRVKPIIDDYDLMSCGLSNNIQDAAEYTAVVSGFAGDDLDELITNIKTKKHIGVGEGGGLEFKTVDIPYEARKQKLELDEKNIYKFGMGLNLAGLKDTAATTNIAIKAAYSLLDLKSSKLIIKLKQFLRKIIKLVLTEINSANGTDYQMKDIYFKFEHEIMSNAQENAQNELTEAQAQQIIINTLLSLATKLDNETLMQLICEALDIDYDDIKGKLPNPDEAEGAVADAQKVLDDVVVDTTGSDVNE